jgi:hypothetical protein
MTAMVMSRSFGTAAARSVSLRHRRPSRRKEFRLLTPCSFPLLEVELLHLRANFQN